MRHFSRKFLSLVTRSFSITTKQNEFPHPMLLTFPLDNFRDVYTMNRMKVGNGTATPCWISRAHRPSRSRVELKSAGRMPSARLCSRSCRSQFSWDATCHRSPTEDQALKRTVASKKAQAAQPPPSCERVCGVSRCPEGHMVSS